MGGRCALAAAVAVAALVGPAAARRDAPLPRSGIAVETSRGVDLVGFDGRRRRTLSGFHFRVLGIERAGQVKLRDRTGRGYELRHGVLSPVPADTMTLPAGYALRFRRGWTLLRGSRTVERFARLTHLELDDTGLVLTSFRVAADGRILSTPTARNLRTGARRTLPKGCRVGIERANVRYELCGYPYAKDDAAPVVRVDARGRRTLAWPAAKNAPHGRSGSWQSVALSPAGDRLLAQWSGECEIPTAYVIDARTGRATALGRDRAGHEVEGVTLGWAGSAALVALPHGACGPSADRPGVYAFDRRGRARLVYPLSARPARAALWR